MSKPQPTTADGKELTKGWRNPFTEDTPLHSLFERRIRNDQDLVILIDDWHARRGTGKTVAAMQLANGMDQTDEGLTEEKVAISPEQIRHAYESQPKRSGLVLDEAEVGVSNRRAMSNANEALRQIMSMGRIEQKYVCINAPSVGFIDKDIRKLADVWITMTAKGSGLVHFLERNPYAEALLTPKKQTITFRDIPRGTGLRDVYNHLTEEKRQRISGDDDSGYIPREEHQKKLEQVQDEADRERRNEILRDLYQDEDLGLSQRDLANVVGLAQPTVQEIVSNTD